MPKTEYLRVNEIAKELESGYAERAETSENSALQDHWLLREAIADVVKDITAKLVADISSEE